MESIDFHPGVFRRRISVRVSEIKDAGEKVVVFDTDWSEADKEADFFSWDHARNFYQEHWD
jgi:hypothetical protein